MDSLELEGGGGEVTVPDHGESMQVLRGDDDHFNRGPASAPGMSPFSRLYSVHRSLSAPPSIDAQPCPRQRSFTISASSNNTTNGEFHIQILDDNVNVIQVSPAHTQDNISPSSLEAQREVAKPLLNRPRLTEVFLVIAAQVVLTLCTIHESSRSTSGRSSFLSPNNSILLGDFAMACNAVGFLCCLYAILLCGRKPGVAARSLTGLGYVAIAYGLLAVMAMKLSGHVMLWITIAAFIASFPALAAAFRK